MDRREMLTKALAGAAIVALPLAAVIGAKRQTLVEYLHQITPFTDGTTEWEITIRRLSDDSPVPLQYDRNSLSCEAGDWVERHYLTTDKGPHRINPKTLELIPFKPKPVGV